MMVRRILHETEDGWETAGLSIGLPAAGIRLNQSGVLPVCWAVVVIVGAKISLSFLKSILHIIFFEVARYPCSSLKKQAH